MVQIIAAFSGGAGLVGIAWLVTHLFRKIRSLEAQVAKLSEAIRQRLPYAAQDELLDAMAAIDRITMDMDALIAIKENARAHIINALQVGTKRADK